MKPLKKPPEWFGKSLKVAQHMDEKAAWPWYARFLHNLIISWRCPCCLEEAKWNK